MDSKIPAADAASYGLLGICLLISGSWLSATPADHGILRGLAGIALLGGGYYLVDEFGSDRTGMLGKFFGYIGSLALFLLSGLTFWALGLPNCPEDYGHVDAFRALIETIMFGLAATIIVAHMLRPRGR